MITRGQLNPVCQGRPKCRPSTNFVPAVTQIVDGRDKPGHDELGFSVSDSNRRHPGESRDPGATATKRAVLDTGLCRYDGVCGSPLGACRRRADGGLVAALRLLTPQRRTAAQSSGSFLSSSFATRDLLTRWSLVATRCRLVGRMQRWKSEQRVIGGISLKDILPAWDGWSRLVRRNPICQSFIRLHSA